MWRLIQRSRSNIRMIAEFARLPFSLIKQSPMRLNAQSRHMLIQKIQALFLVVSSLGALQECEERPCNNGLAPWCHAQAKERGCHHLSGHLRLVCCGGKVHACSGRNRNKPKRRRSTPQTT